MTVRRPSLAAVLALVAIGALGAVGQRHFHATFAALNPGGVTRWPSRWRSTSCTSGWAKPTRRRRGGDRCQLSRPGYPPRTGRSFATSLLRQDRLPRPRSRERGDARARVHVPVPPRLRDHDFEDDFEDFFVKSTSRPETHRGDARSGHALPAAVQRPAERPGQDDANRWIDAPSTEAWPRITRQP